MSLFRRNKKKLLIHQQWDFSRRLKKLLGFTPVRLDLYEKAFIHRSATVSAPNGRPINNERLEYLGDAVLDTVISDYLFHRFPEAREGYLTKMRSRLVNREYLNEAARTLGLEQMLVSQVPSGLPVKNLFGDALEAFIGAIFLDAGYTTTKKFITRRVLRRNISLEEILQNDHDYKSQVFEWVQKNQMQISFIHQEDFDHCEKRSVFSTRLVIDGKEAGRGRGCSKKEAEQKAADEAWKRFCNN